MEDEIKEINLSEMLFNRDERLLDYITNLEKENKNYKSGNKLLERELSKLCNRENKAIEYINEYCIDDEYYINLTNKEKNIIEVKNILTGGKNED